MARRRKPQNKPRGRTVKVKKRVKGRSKNPSRDRLYKALPPGKRRSHTGKIYYEYRANRADIPKKKKRKRKK